MKNEYKQASIGPVVLEIAIELLEKSFYQFFSQIVASMKSLNHECHLPVSLLRGDNWMLLAHRPQCTVTLNSN